MNRPSRTCLATRFLALGLLASAMLPLGCGNKTAEAGGGGGGQMSAGDAALTAKSGDYVSLYTAGKYPQAKSAAESAARSASGVEKDQATLFAGMSAHAMGPGKRDEAERILSPLVTSSDPSIAGRAGATLGLINQGRKQHQKAVDQLTVAAEKLTGDDAARAHMYAGDSLEALGRRAEARDQFAAAETLATNAKVKSQLANRLDSGRFAVQLGVFGQKQNAQKAASQATPKSAKLGLGTPKLVQRKAATGKPEYVVRLEPFPSKQAAINARSQLGTGTVVELTQAE